MRINRADKIVGQPVLKVRDFFRKTESSRFTPGDVEEWFKVSEREATAILLDLFARGLVEPNPSTSQDDRYRTTNLGRQLAIARAVSPISRERADKFFAEFMVRIEEVNTRDELTHYVERVGLFGSYLDEKAVEYADIDIMLDLRHREIPGRDPIHYNYERAAASGKHIGNLVEHLGFGENEVRLLLKARNQYLSFHNPEDLERIGVKPKIVFKAESKKPGS